MLARCIPPRVPRDCRGLTSAFLEDRRCSRLADFSRRRGGAGGQLPTGLRSEDQAGVSAPAAGRRRAGGLAARLGGGGARGDHRAPRRVPRHLPRRLEGRPIKAPVRAPDGTGWPLEQCAYWLDGAIRLGFVLHDEALIQQDPRPARPDRGRRQQGRFRHVVHLLEKGLQAGGLQQLGAFADGPRAGGALPGHRRQTGARRLGQGLCRLSGEDGADRFLRRQRLVQPGRDAGDLFLQRRPAHPRSRARGHRPARGGQGLSGVERRPPASGPHGHLLREHPLAGPGVSLVGRPAPASGHAGRAEVAGREPHAALRRGLGRGVRVGQSARSARPKPAT